MPPKKIKVVKGDVDVIAKEERPKRAATKRPIIDSPVVPEKKPKRITKPKATKTKSANNLKVGGKETVLQKKLKLKENDVEIGHGEPAGNKVLKKEKLDTVKGEKTNGKKKAVKTKDDVEEPVLKKQPRKRKASTSNDVDINKDNKEVKNGGKGSKTEEPKSKKTKLLNVDKPKEVIEKNTVKEGKLKSIEEKTQKEEPAVKKSIKRQKEPADEKIKKKTTKVADLQSEKLKKEKVAKKVTAAKGTTKKVAVNKTETEYTSIDFDCNKLSINNKPWNLKISSWNVDGLRSWVSKNGLEYINQEKPDILCLQEIRCSQEKMPEEIKKLEGYHPYWVCGEKDGYAGVGILSKRMPRSVTYGLADKKFDDEGRIITAEYSTFYLVCTYVPNAGRGLVTLPKRLEWNASFRKHINELNEKKPVIICGDLNVAHNEIDLKNPKTNKKNAGFTIEERTGMSDLLKDGYVDSFRSLYPEIQAFTFWTYMKNARANDVGWRLDYFLVSERLMSSVCDNVIRKTVRGSDHCPITLFINTGGAPRHLVDESYATPSSTT